MRAWGALLLASVAAAGLAGCGLGARDVDYSRDRGISDDINATYTRGPTAARPGMEARQEPIGAFPWTLDERHGSGR